MRHCPELFQTFETYCLYPPLSNEQPCRSPNISISKVMHCISHYFLCVSEVPRAHRFFVLHVLVCCSPINRNIKLFFLKKQIISFFFSSELGWYHQFLKFPAQQVLCITPDENHRANHSLDGNEETSTPCISDFLQTSTRGVSIFSCVKISICIPNL